MNTRLGFIALLSAAVLYSTLGIMARFLEQYFGNNTQAAVRSLGAVILLIIFFRIKSITFRLKKVNKFAFVIFVVVNALSSISFIFSVTYIKASNTVFYLYVALFIASFVVGRLLFREKVTTPKLLSLSIALIGMLIFSYPLEASLTNPGVVFGLIAGITDAIVYSSQKYLTDQNRRVLVFYRYLGAVAVSFLLAVVTNEQMVKHLSLELIPGLIVISLILIALTELLLIGFANFPLNLGSIIVSAELPFALIVNGLVLLERPTGNEILGSILLFTAIIITEITNKKQPEVLVEA